MWVGSLILVAIWTALGPFLFMYGAGKQKVHQSNWWFVHDLLLVIFCGPVVWIMVVALLIQSLRE